MPRFENPGPAEIRALLGRARDAGILAIADRCIYRDRAAIAAP